MKCMIPGTNVKIFGKCIHSLSKIGEEVYFEPLEDGLALRTVNASRSAYACFVFAPSFFTQYDNGSRPTRQGDSPETDETAIKCKVGVRSCMTVFKSLATLEKTVDRCKISLNMDEARLVFQLYCRHGIVKTHNLAFIECETLQAVFSKDMTPNKLTAQSRLLCDAVVNFQTNQEEVTLCVNPEKVLLKNYVDDEPDPNKVIRTELGIDPEEFDDYQVGIDTDVTFCLKELRAILAFSESANLPVSMHFETSGRPIVFCIDSDSTFEANFVLATLADPSNSLPNTQQSTQATTQARPKTQNQRRSNHTLRKPAHSTSRSTSQLIKGPRHRGNGDATTFNSNQFNTSREGRQQSHAEMQATYVDIANESTTLHTDNTLHADDPMEGTSSVVPQISNSRNNSSTSLTSNMHNVNRDSSNKQQNTFRTLSNQNAAFFKSTNETDTRTEQGSGDGISPDIPVQNSKQSHTSVLLGDDSDLTASEEDEPVPGTPPAKKFKSIFFGISQSPTQTSQRPRVSKPAVLVEDTDEED